MKQPNIVFICTDQQRFDSLGCCGNTFARTPNIDRIANGGTRFARHITPCQICAPSRGSIFTGLYPRTHRLYANGIALEGSLPTLPSVLAAAGYQTHGIGKFHFQPLLAPSELEMPESKAFWKSHDPGEWRGPFYGFDAVEFVMGDGPEAAETGHYGKWLRDTYPEGVELYDKRNALEPLLSDLEICWKSAIPADWHYNTWIAERAAEFIREVEAPFFMFVSFPDPHPPFCPPAPYCYAFDPHVIPMPRVKLGELEALPPYYLEPPHPDEQGKPILTTHFSESTLRQVIAHTYGLVQMIDDSVGRVLNSIESKGFADNTIVLFTSDHGELLGDHGLLQKGPPPYRQLLEVPLLMRGPHVLVGQQVDTLTSHIDLMPTLCELAGVELDELTFEGRSLVPLLDGSLRSIRGHAFSEYHPRAAHDLYNQTISTEQWRMTIYPEHLDWGELFDLTDDPFEHRNLYTHDAHNSVREGLRDILSQEFPPRRATDAKRICKW